MEALEASEQKIRAQVLEKIDAIGLYKFGENFNSAHVNEDYIPPLRELASTEEMKQYLQEEEPLTFLSEFFDELKEKDVAEWIARHYSDEARKHIYDSFIYLEMLECFKCLKQKKSGMEVCFVCDRIFCRDCVEYDRFPICKDCYNNPNAVSVETSTCSRIAKALSGKV